MSLRVDNKIKKNQFDKNSAYIKFNNNKPVLLLVTAVTCPACRVFKARVWSSLKEALEKENQVNILTLEVPTNNSKPPATYHKDLSKFIRWYPTLMLFPGKLWNQPESKLEGKVYFGSFDEKGEIQPIQNINFDKNVILSWVEETINTSEFKKDSSNDHKTSTLILITDKGKPLGGITRDLKTPKQLLIKRAEEVKDAKTNKHVNNINFVPQRIM